MSEPDGRNTQDATYDVVIAGAGIAGCTAATLYGRLGLRVALVETHRDPHTFKRLCTHFIQASAVPTLRRLGLDRTIESAGGVPNSIDVWTPYGWVDAPRMGAGLPQDGYNIRRSELEPMLREMAGATPGVELLLGHKVVDLVRHGEQVSGLIVRDRAGRRHELHARLTVGADGRQSVVAAKSDLPSKPSPHGRFGFSAHYTGVRLQTDASSQFWLDGRGMNLAFTNDSGRVVLGAMRPAEELAAFREDIEGNLLASFDRLPRPPDLTAATRVSDLIAMINYPGHRRKPVGPGFALVGDAALVTDYLWGVGLGWAFQGAEWLVDATGVDLVCGQDLRTGLKRYARRLGRRLGPHHMMISDFATGRPFNRLERLVYAAAAVDDVVAATFGAIGARATSPFAVLTPAMVTRMLRARRRAGPPVDIPQPRTMLTAEQREHAAGRTTAP